MQKLVAVAVSLLIILTVQANDSLRTLTLNSYLQIVKKYHPVSRQARIQVDKANASVLMAKGEFDPFLESNGSNKTFDGINYYQHNTFQISIPTWYGIEIETGIEYLTGNRTDPQETSGRTSFAGISIPLAKNLLMDKRRAALQQAKIMMDASEQEQKIMLNDLLKEASDTYWQWVLANFNYQTYTAVLATNRKRISMVKQAFEIGEIAAIDTIEATTQLQSFEYFQNEAFVALQNATLVLNNFLWKENNEPYYLPFNIVFPEEKIESLFTGVNFPEIEQIVENTKNNHPELQLFQYKLNFLTVERKLKFQELLPNLDVKYNQLGKGYNIASTATKPLFENNYRYGLHFSMPLRISQGRGAYRTAKLKIAETELEFSQKKNAFANQVKAVYNQLVNYNLQVNLLQKTYTNFLSLQKAEETRFFNGESSLFLVNTRENKSLETLLKLSEATVTLHKTTNTLKWAAGELWTL